MEELHHDQLLMNARCLSNTSRGAISGSLAIVVHICKFIKDVEGCTDVDDLSKVRIINCMGAICNFLTRTMDAKYGISSILGDDLKGEDLKEAKKELYETVIKCFTRDNEQTGVTHHEYDLEMVTKVKMELISLGQEIRKLKRNISLYKVVKSNVVQDLQAYKQVDDSNTDEEKQILKRNMQRVIGNVQPMIRQNHISTLRNVKKLHSKNATLEKAIENTKTQIDEYSKMLMELVKKYPNAELLVQLSDEALENRSLLSSYVPVNDIFKRTRPGAEIKHDMKATDDITESIKPEVPETIEDETDVNVDEQLSTDVQHSAKRKNTTDAESQIETSNKPRKIDIGTQVDENIMTLMSIVPPGELAHEIVQATTQLKTKEESAGIFDEEMETSGDISTDGTWNYETVVGSDVTDEMKDEDIMHAEEINPQIYDTKEIISIKTDSVKTDVLAKEEEEEPKTEIETEHFEAVDATQTAQDRLIIDVPLQSESDIKEIVLKIMNSIDGELKNYGIEAPEATKVYLQEDQADKSFSKGKMVVGRNLNISNQTTIVSTSDINATQGRSLSILNVIPQSRNNQIYSIDSDDIEVYTNEEPDVVNEIISDSDVVISPEPQTATIPNVGDDITQDDHPITSSIPASIGIVTTDSTPLCEAIEVTSFVESGKNNVLDINVEMSPITIVDPEKETKDIITECSVSPSINIPCLTIEKRITSVTMAENTILPIIIVPAADSPIGENNMDQNEETENEKTQPESNTSSSLIEIQSPEDDVWDEIRNIKAEVAFIKQVLAGIENHLGSYTSYTMKINKPLDAEYLSIETEASLDAAFSNSYEIDENSQDIEVSNPESAIDGDLDLKDVNPVNVLETLRDEVIDAITNTEDSIVPSDDDSIDIITSGEEQKLNNTLEGNQHLLFRQNASEFFVTDIVARELRDKMASELGENDITDGKTVITETIQQEATTIESPIIHIESENTNEDISAETDLFDIAETPRDDHTAIINEESDEMPLMEEGHESLMEYISCDEDERDTEHDDSNAGAVSEPADSSNTFQEFSSSEELVQLSNATDAIAIVTSIESVSLSSAINVPIDADIEEREETRDYEALCASVIPHKEDIIEPIETSQATVSTAVESNDVSETTLVMDIPKVEADTTAFEGNTINTSKIEVHHNIPLEIQESTSDALECHDELASEVNGEGNISQEKEIDYLAISHDILKQLETLHAMIMNDEASEISTRSLFSAENSQGSIGMEEMDESNFEDYAKEETHTSSNIYKRRETNEDDGCTGAVENSDEHHVSSEQANRLNMDVNVPTKTSDNIDFGGALTYIGMFSQVPITTIAMNDDTLSKQYENFQMFKAFLRASGEHDTKNENKDGITNIGDADKLNRHFSPISDPMSSIFGKYPQ